MLTLLWNKEFGRTVKHSIEKSVSAFSEEKLKKAVQEAVTDDDRSKKMIVFGMTEENSEDLDRQFSALFGEIEEKPTFEATRVGMVSSDRISQRRSLYGTVKLCIGFCLKRSG